MIEWLSINPHLLPFFILFMGGLTLLAVSFVHIGVRTKKYIFAPFVPHKRCDNFEKKCFNYAVICAGIGFFGMLLLIQILGYKYIETDVDGNKKIKYMKADRIATQSSENNSPL